MSSSKKRRKKKSLLRRFWFPLDLMGLLFATFIISAFGPAFYPEMLNLVEDTACPYEEYDLKVVVHATQDSFHPGATQLDVDLLCVDPSSGHEITGNSMARVALFGLILLAMYGVIVIAHNFPMSEKNRQRLAILKRGRVYLIIFLVSAVLAVATVALCLILNVELFMGGAVHWIAVNPLIAGASVFGALFLTILLLYRPWKTDY